MWTMKMSNRASALIVAAGLASSLAGCTSTLGPTAACEDAVVQALAEEQELYDTHPLWDLEATTPDSSPEEFAEWERLRADEEAQWATIYNRVYANCENPADWWAAAQIHPAIAGVTDAKFLTPEDIKLWCTDSLDKPACVGIDEWLESL